MAKTAQIQLHSGPWGSCGTNGSLRVTWHKLRECCLGIGPKSLSRPLKQSQNPYGNQERTSIIYTFNHLSPLIQYIPWRHANIGSCFYYVPVLQHLDTCYYMLLTLCRSRWTWAYLTLLNETSLQRSRFLPSPEAVPRYVHFSSNVAMWYAPASSISFLNALSKQSKCHKSRVPILYPVIVCDWLTETCNLQQTNYVKNWCF